MEPVFRNPSIADVFESILVPAVFKPYAQDLIARARPIGPSDRILDLGCGTGIVARLLRERLGGAARVSGLDISAPMIAKARALAPEIDWHEGTAMKLPFADGSFDLVLCQQMLQFVPDPLVALHEVRRVLVPGGRLLVSTWRPRTEQPLFDALGRAAERHLGASNDKRWSLDGERLRELLVSAGFADVVSHTHSLVDHYTEFPIRSSTLASNFEVAALAEAELERKLQQNRSRRPRRARALRVARRRISRRIDHEHRQRHRAPERVVTRPDFDVIVVGARCAGSPTAMLLARAGYKVLVVDRSTFPSDTISTHVVHPLGVAALKRWGVLDRLVASGCPPIDTYAFDFGPFTITGTPGTADTPVAYCPRRTVLDKLLVDAAADAGAEMREGFLVDEVLRDGIASSASAAIRRTARASRSRARVVIGADGRNSVVAKAVQPAEYHREATAALRLLLVLEQLADARSLRDLHPRAPRLCRRRDDDGLTMIVGGWPYAEFEANKRDLETHYDRLFDLAPDFAARVRGAKRVDRVYGAVTPNSFRKPFGLGWALVGDAGYIKDPITAQGITDAFRDAELVTSALDASLSGAQPYDAAMASYQRTRDAQSLPMYEMTCQLASLEPPPPDFQHLLGAVHGNRAAMDDFCRMNAGTISPAAFFAPENIGAILGAR